MGDIYDQFELELASLGRKYAGHPRRQMIRLFLLALEREEIVSVGLPRRSDRCPAGYHAYLGQEREIIRHALLWIWKDEEMHAIYIRGAIFKVGTFPLRARALLRPARGCTWRLVHLGSSARSLVRSPTLADDSHTPYLDRIAYRKSSVRRPAAYSLSVPFATSVFSTSMREKTAWLCWQRINRIDKRTTIHAALIDRRFSPH